jgi:AraC family ethanolamine operon transcriptional activator
MPATSEFRRTHRIDANPRAFAGADCAFTPLRHLPHAAAIASTQAGPFIFTLAHLPPGLMDITALPGRSCVLVPMTDMYAPLVNGQRMQPVHLITLQPGTTILVRDDTPTLMGSIAFDHTRYHWPMDGIEPDVRLIDLAALNGLRKTLLAALQSTSTADEPASIAQRLPTPPGAADWIDDTLGTARDRFYRWSFSGPNPLPVMARIDSFIDTNRNRPIYLKEVADVANVSMRKLHNVVVQLRGMSLTRYLKLRRLWNAYQELLGAQPGELIKTVALRNGFWHLGDFAREYNRQFGESPSDTRAQGPTGQQPTAQGTPAHGTLMSDGREQPHTSHSDTLHAWLADFAMM